MNRIYLVHSLVVNPASLRYQLTTSSSLLATPEVQTDRTAIQVIRLVKQQQPHPLPRS